VDILSDGSLHVKEVSVQASWIVDDDAYRTSSMSCGLCMGALGTVRRKRGAASGWQLASC
jgi:hypothetical protein